MDRCLIVVSRDRPELWQELRQNYAQAEGVEIILDRRQDQRSSLSEEGSDRRGLFTASPDFQGQGFVVVPRP